MINPIDFDVGWRNKIKTAPVGYKKLGYNRAVEDLDKLKEKLK